MATTKKAKSATAKRKPATAKKATVKKVSNSTKVEARTSELLVYIFTALSIVFLIVAILKAA